MEYSAASRVVLHCIRGFLQKTETFFADRIRTSHRYRPTLLSQGRVGRFDMKRTDLLTIPNLLHPFRRVFRQIPHKGSRSISPFSVAPLKVRSKQHHPGILHLLSLVADRSSFHKRLDIPFVVPACRKAVSSFFRMCSDLGTPMVRSVFRHTDRLIAMSKGGKRDFIGLGYPELQIIFYYNGIDQKRFIQFARASEADSGRNVL